MTKKFQRKRIIIPLKMLGLLVLAMSLHAQTSAREKDADEINYLIKGLSNHTVNPAAVLDPSLSPSDRERSLHQLSSSSYELNLVALVKTPMVNGLTASVPVRVHFDRKDGNTLDAKATAQFVKRGGAWYFSSYDFLNWPAFLVIVLGICILIGIAYAVIVITLLTRLRRQGERGLNTIKIFIPFLWPSQFRRSSR